MKEHRLPRQGWLSEEQAAWCQWPSPTSMAYLSQSVGCWAPWSLRSLFTPSRLWDRSWSWSIQMIPSQKAEKRCGIQLSLQWVFESLHWADWQVTGPSHCRASAGSQEWGCGGLSTGGACVHCWTPGGPVQTAHPHGQTHYLLEPWHTQHERPLSIREGVHCQDSIPPYWTGILLHYYFHLSYIVFHHTYYAFCFITVKLFFIIFCNFSCHLHFTFVSHDLSPPICSCIYTVVLVPLPFTHEGNHSLPKRLKDCSIFGFVCSWQRPGYAAKMSCNQLLLILLCICSRPVCQAYWPTFDSEFIATFGLILQSLILLDVPT